MLQVSFLNSTHPPHAPKLNERPWPEGPWPLGAQYLASNSEQLWTFKNAFDAELASSHICLLGSHTFKNYEVTGGACGGVRGIETFRFTREAL